MCATVQVHNVYTAYTYVHTYICLYVHMYICLYVRTYICTYIFMYVCTYITIYIVMCVYIDVSVHAIHTFRYLMSF